VDADKDGRIDWGEFVAGAYHLYSPSTAKTTQKPGGVDQNSSTQRSENQGNGVQVKFSGGGSGGDFVVHRGTPWAIASAAICRACGGRDGESFVFEYTDVVASREAMGRAMEMFGQVDPETQRIRKVREPNVKIQNDMTQNHKPHRPQTPNSKPKTKTQNPKPGTL
jgi:hypothetical protein